MERITLSELLELLELNESSKKEHSEYLTAHQQAYADTLADCEAYAAQLASAEENCAIFGATWIE